MEKQEYRERLRKKISKEAHEVASACPAKLVEELGDLYETIETLWPFTTSIVPRLSTRKHEREERGDVQGRIKLLWVHPIESDEKSGDGT